MVIVWPVIWAIENRALKKTLEIFQHYHSGVDFVVSDSYRHEAIEVKQFRNECIVIVAGHEVF